MELNAQPSAQPSLAGLEYAPRHLLTPNGIACGETAENGPRRVTLKPVQVTCLYCTLGVPAGEGAARWFGRLSWIPVPVWATVRSTSVSPRVVG